MTTHSSASAGQHSLSSGDSVSGSKKRSRAPYRALAGGRVAGTTGQKTVAGSEARRRGAVILEVLAGVHTPTSAAQALGIGVPRYYLLEQQALEGLVQACEPRPKGRTISSDRQIARLERELAVCRRELGRQQALTRAAQRVLGLKPATVPAASAGKNGPGKGPSSAAAGSGKRSRKRRPVVRALRAARVLQTGVPVDSSIPAVVGEVQIPAGDVPLAAGGNPGAAGTAGPSLEPQGAQGG